MPRIQRVTEYLFYGFVYPVCLPEIPVFIPEDTGIKMMRQRIRQGFEYGSKQYEYCRYHLTIAPARCFICLVQASYRTQSEHNTNYKPFAVKIMLISPCRINLKEADNRDKGCNYHEAEPFV